MLFKSEVEKIALEKYSAMMSKVINEPKEKSTNILREIAESLEIGHVSDLIDGTSNRKLCAILDSVIIARKSKIS